MGKPLLLVNMQVEFMHSDISIRMNSLPARVMSHPDWPQYRAEHYDPKTAEVENKQHCFGGSYRLEQYPIAWQAMDTISINRLTNMVLWAHRMHQIYTGKALIYIDGIEYYPLPIGDYDNYCRCMQEKQEALVQIRRQVLDAYHTLQQDAGAVLGNDWEPANYPRPDTLINGFVIDYRFTTTADPVKRAAILHKLRDNSDITRFI